MNKDIFFLGIQCSGKGTQSKLLLKNLAGKYEHLEMGQLFRAIMSNDNIIGNYVKDTVHRGALVDPFVSRDWFNTALEIVSKKGVALMVDGFPRSLSQAEFVLPNMEKYKRDFVVIHLLLPREKAIERMTKRAALEGRTDDTPEAMSTRIEAFTTETLAVIEHFATLGKVIAIDGDRTIEEVQEDLKSKLGF